MNTNDTKLHARQRAILQFISSHGETKSSDITAFCKDVSRVTIVRDLAQLLQHGLIYQKGAGRGTRYYEKIANPLLRYIDSEEYFAKGPDERQVTFERFNFKIFELLDTLFSAEELKRLQKENLQYQQKVRKLSKTLLQKNFERLTIELSWKSSQIEGNTYSLLDTEALIKEQKEARGHTKEEAIMILNHKRALDYIFQSPQAFQKLSLRNILSIHDLLVKDLSITRGIRQRKVGVIGTRFQPLDNEHQIREALEKFIKLVNRSDDSFSRALVAIAMISYIQPFEDGNKRTARLLGNALLITGNACPLSFRSVDEVEYKKAIILFDEQNNLRLLKDIFMEQFFFAVQNYF